ncbi:MAG: hypothetical protein KDD64_15585, partial [Bdellovibrionales bacterium]|nr:hypothetical protein [Bdellovibrionales bacterium]
MVEFVVAAGLGTVLTTIMLSTFIGNREMVRYDLERTSVNQNLRSVLDIVGMNIRLAGENLPSTFPAIEVIDGASGAPDQLILRRNLRDEILKVCADIPALSFNNLFFAVAGVIPGCTFDDQLQNYNSWNTYLTESGGEALGYIYDPTTRLGEFFSFNGVTNTGVELNLVRSSPGGWQNGYTVGQAAAYVIEEWRFVLNGDVLELYENGDLSNPSRVSYGLSDFQVSVALAGGTTVTSFGT